MKLNEIQTFVTVARAGSIQAAAKQLHMTQSAVSRLVQRLELDIGATLFDRHAKPLVLTHEGRIALEHGRRVLSTTDAFAEAFAPTAGPNGILRIGTAHALAKLIAERPLDLLRSLFPDLTLQISVDWANPLIERLHKGELDAAMVSLLTDSKPKTDLPSRCLGTEDVLIVGAANLASTRWCSLQEMNTIGWAIQPKGCGYRTALKQALERAGAGSPKVVVESFDKELQLSVVARGAGFALLPSSHLNSLSIKRKIKAFKAPDFQASVSTWLIRRPQLGQLSKPMDEIERLLNSAHK